MKAAEKTNGQRLASVATPDTDTGLHRAKAQPSPGAVTSTHVMFSWVKKTQGLRAINRPWARRTPSEPPAPTIRTKALVRWQTHHSNRSDQTGWTRPNAHQKNVQKTNISSTSLSITAAILEWNVAIRTSSLGGLALRGFAEYA